MAEKLTKAERKFYKAEGDILDRVYREKMNEWQKLTDMYNLRFRDQIRDIDRDNYVKISRFYPLVRQIIASIAFNYPTMLFTVDEEEGIENDIPDVLERASKVAFNLMAVKRNVHQAIFDASRRRHDPSIRHKRRYARGLHRRESRSPWIRPPRPSLPSP